MVKKPKAIKIKDLNNYAGEVVLFNLSKGIKKGAVTFKHIVIARIGRPGSKNTTVWLANEDGNIAIIEPIREFNSTNMTEALTELGYTL